MSIIFSRKIIIILFYLLSNVKSQENFGSLICLYPRAYTMHNGNNILVCKDGIYVYNSNFKEKINFEPFDTQISSNTDADFVTIAQYPNNGNIIIITKDKFYYLSSEGDIFFNTDLSIDNSGLYYTLVPYLYNFNYNFIVGFINSSKYFNIIYYTINTGQEKIEIIKDLSPNIKNSLGYTCTNLYHGFQCEMMYSDTLGDLLTCFHFDLYPGEIGAFSLYLNTDIELINDLCVLYELDNISPQFLKSAISLDKSKALISFVDMNKLGYYMTYDINKREFTDIINYFKIGGVYPSHLQVQYFSGTHEYIISYTDKKNYKMAKFNENMSIITDDNLNSQTNQDFSLSDDGYYGIFFYNIVFMPDYETYIFILDSNLYGNITARFYYLPDYFSPKTIYPNQYSSSNNIPTSIITPIPTTIVTTIPTTIFATIPKTIITSIPTTIITTIPKTIITSIPTTIITTIPKTIITSIPTTIITTIPKTIITSIPTTISKTFITSIPTTIITTIPKSIPTTIITTIPKTIITNFPTIFINNPATLAIKTIPTTIITNILTAIIGIASNNIITTTPFKEEAVQSTIVTTIPKPPINSFTTIFQKSNEIKSDNIYSKVCPPELFYTNKESGECEKLCTYNEFINDLCFINNLTENNIMNITQNIRDLIKELELNENLNIVINGYNAIYQIISSEIMDENKNKNISIIDFGECEELLKKVFNLDYIIILQIDIFLNNSSNIVLKYEVYNPNTLEKIDLSICKDMNINTYLPYYLSDEEKELFIKLDNFGYDLFNGNGSFYRDLCTPFTTDKKTDITLLDRRRDYFKNITFCEEACTYKSYDYANEKVQCVCVIKELMNEKINNIKFYGSLFFTTFLNLKDFSNIEVIACYKLVFSKLGQIRNYGSYLFIFFIFFFLICMIIFHINGKNQITKIINTFINYKYIKSPIKKKSVNNKNKKNIQKKGNIIINKNIVINNNNYINNKIKKKHSHKNFIDKSNNLLNMNSLNTKTKINILDSNLLTKLIKKGRNLNKKSTKSSKIKNKFGKANKNNAIKEKKYIYNEIELNTLKYNKAIIYDKRTYIQYYCSLIKQKHMIMFTFISNNDYNLFVNKFSLFIFSFSLYFLVNALFFDNHTVHKIYATEGKLQFIYNILHIIYSTIISSGITLILKLLALSNNNILNIKKIYHNNRNKIRAKKIGDELLKKLIIKFNIYYIMGFLLLDCFWYFISAFCAVYNNSQLLLKK